MSKEYIVIDSTKYIYDIEDLYIKKTADRVGFFSFIVDTKKGHSISDFPLTKKCEIYSNNKKIFTGVIDKRTRSHSKIKIEGRDLLGALLDAPGNPADFNNNTVEEIINGCPHPFGNSSFEEGLAGWQTYASADAGTEILRPNGDSSIELNRKSGTTNYENVDESTADDDSTYVYYTVNAADGKTYIKRDLYTLQDHSVGTGNINYIKVHFRCKYESENIADLWAEAVIKIGGSEYVGSRKFLSKTYQTFSYMWDKNPATGEAWTWTDIDNLEAGVRLFTARATIGGESSCTTKCTQVYVEVSYGSVVNFEENTDLNYVYKGLKSAKWDSGAENATATLKKRLYLDTDDDPKLVTCTCQAYITGSDTTSSVELKLANKNTNSTVLNASEYYSNNTSYHTDYDYYAKIDIDNSSNSNTLTNYQIKVELDSSNFDFSKAQSDGADIRFTNTSGTDLDYWIEEWDSTNETATIWVEVDSIPASSTTQIYMFYGNSSATSASNGDNTFIFFDDAETGSVTDKWNITNGDQGTVEYNSSVAYTHSKSLKIDKTATDTYLAVTCDAFTNMSNVIIDLYAKHNETTEGRDIRLQGDVRSLYLNFSNTGDIKWWNGSSMIDTGTDYGTSWEHYELICTSSDNKIKILRNGVEIEDDAHEQSWSYINKIQFISGQAHTPLTYYDRILVREYADPEPSVSVDSYTDQRNTWNKLTTSLDVSDDCYFDIEITASGDSNTQVYIDDVRFAYTKDGYSQSIYDNGILFGIDPDLTSNIDCDTIITKFTTTQTETRLTEVDRLLNLLDRSKYLFYMEDNCIYLKQRSATNTLTLHDGQFYAISYEEDARPLKHTCFVNSTGFGEDWKQIGQKIANAPYCMLCDPDGDWILLGSWINSSNPGHIRKSTDEGKTWTKVKTFSTNGCYPYAFYYDYDNNTIYCMTIYDGVWKSTDDGDTWTLEVDKGDYAGQMVKLKDRSTGKEYLFFGSQDSSNSNRPTIWRKELPSGSWEAIYYNSNYYACLGLNGFENILIVSFYNTGDVRILRCENPFDTSPTFEIMQQWSSTYNIIYWIEKRYNKSIENYDLYTTFEKAAGGGTVLRSRDRGETWTVVDDQDTTFAVRSRNIYTTDHTIYVAWEGDGSNNYGGIRSSTDEGSTWTTEITSTCYGFIPMSSKTPFVYTADNSATGTGQIKIMRKVEPYTLLGSYSDSSVVSSYGDNPRFHSYLTVSDLKTLSGVKTVAQNYVDSYKVPRKTLKLSVPLDISYQLLSYININSKQNADLNGSYYVMDVEYDFPNARCVISLDNRPYDDLDAIVDRMKLEIEKNSTSLLSGRVIRYNSTNNTCDIVLDTTNPNELRRTVLYSIHCAGVTPTKGDHVYLMSPHFDRSRYVVISKD